MKFQFPAIFWALLIFSLSSIHHIPEINSPVSPDKVAHTGVFFLLTMFCWRAFKNQGRIRWLSSYPAFSAFAFTCFYGISDELHQRYVPGRTPDVNDLVFDIFGGVLFVVVLWLLQYRKASREA
ncbi:MAG: VanZ family protein [Bacteroidota bacterium]